MFELKASVKIVRADGSAIYTFGAVQEIIVKKSIHEYTDTASFQIPASARLKLERKNQIIPLLPQTISNINTAAEFKEGDAVTIQLGYDDKLETEFVGFISKVNFTRPCKVECEGYSWLLRNSDKLITKSWISTSLVEVLNYIIDNTGNNGKILLSTDIPDTVFGPLRLEKKTGMQCLEEIKKGGFTIYFIDNVIYAGLEQAGQIENSVVYSLGWNTIKDDQLKYRSQDEVKVQIEVTYKDKAGRMQVKVIGDAGGVVKRLDLGRELDMKVLESKAMAWAHKYRYTGYEGRITAFLQPYAQPGWKATIQDQEYKDRTGEYILVSTEINYNKNGGRRICEIGKSLTANQNN